ncbi:MAG: hypothetical protein JOZ42_12825 [Acetobacteraceae bacterium]|nr:hypothetical protein [Acetobacteraceae bacterium]
MLIQPGREFIQQSEVPGSSQPIPPQTTMAELMETEIQILTGRSLLDGVISELGADRIYPALAAAPAANIPLQEAATNALARDLDATPVKLSNVIAVTVRNPDRAVALEILKAALAAFRERHVAAFRHTRTPMLEQQLTAETDALTRAQRELTEFEDQQRVFSLAEQRSTLIQQRSRDEDTLLAAETERAGLVQQRGFLEAKLAQEPGTIALAASTQDAPPLADAQKRVQELEQQRRELLTRYQPGSVMVSAVQAALDSAQAFLAKTREKTATVTTGPNPIAAALKTQFYNVGASLVPLDGKIAQLKAAIADTDAKLSHLTENEAHLLQLNRRVEQLGTTTAMLQQRLVDARYLEDLDRAHVTSIKVVDEPSAATKPVWPKRLIVLGAGVAGGLAFSALVLLLALSFHDRVLLPETIERTLGIPMIAVLPIAERPVALIAQRADSSP